MKKLSIEEKAKAYDKVREKIAIRFGSNVADEIFSEYEESEDERIRKWLIGYFHQYKEDGMEKYANGLKVESIIAWLEKQKAIDVLDEEEREFADNVDSYRKEIDAAYQKGYNEEVKATLEKQG